MEELRYQVDLLKAMNQKLKREDRKYHAIFNTFKNAYLYYSIEEDAVDTYGNWGGLFDFEVKSLRDVELLFDRVRPQDVDALKSVLRPELSGRQSDSCQFVIKNTAKRRWLECEVRVCQNVAGQPVEKIWCFRDITIFRQQNEELRYMAYYDTLTGLYSRNYFVQKLNEWVDKASREKAVISVVFIDIDDFRKINDGIGMLEGDELIQALGQFLAVFAEDERIICSHFNSDLYCMAIYEPVGRRSVENIYRMIRERLQKPFRLSGSQHTITVSVGVAEYPEAAQTALELINCAEIIMYKGKKTSKDSIRYFDEPIIQEFLQNVTIDRKLNKAVMNEAFLLYYQPQFEVESGRLRGMEALIRWQDTDGAWMPPAEFIPIAESNGTIIPIGDWVIEQGIAALARWQKDTGLSPVLSLNISVVQYKRCDFVEKLLAVLKRYGVRPENVELEITESVLIDDFEEIIARMVTLREYGLRISVDDFGTGFSSLSYLRSLPVDVLKVDKSFLDDVTKDAASRVIVDAIIQMASRLGFETIAEGVETKEQLACLKEMGCKYVQGYLLARPLPEEGMEALLREQMM